VYVTSLKNDYTLFHAFNTLGVHLYGPGWSGYEIRRERVEDPTPILEARAPLEEQLEQAASLLSAKYNEQKEVSLKKDIHRVNDEIEKARQLIGDLHFKLNEIGEVQNHEVDDFGRWERFEQTEGALLKALGNDELRVVCVSGSVVKPSFWYEMPEGFTYNFEHSLIYWPSRHSSKKVDSGYVREDEFEEWLETIIPIVPHDGANISIEKRAQSWLKEYVKFWDGITKRDQIKDLAMSEYPDLGGRAFKRIWDAEASVAMKSPGPRKST